jgi:hypothetical protein
MVDAPSPPGPWFAAPTDGWLIPRWRRSTWNGFRLRHRHKRSHHTGTYGIPFRTGIDEIEVLRAKGVSDGPQLLDHDAAPYNYAHMMNAHARLMLATEP